MNHWKIREGGRQAFDPRARRPAEAEDELERPSGGGRKDDTMVTNSASMATSVSASKIIPLSMTALLGLFIVGFVGFSHMEVVHNAAHDSRQSLAFPCH